MERGWANKQSKRLPIFSPHTSTTSFLTATTLIYAIGAGITAAAGTRLALQLFIDKCCALFSIQLQNRSSALWFIVTTSLCQDWVIYAPAAFLGCGSHLSGSLSEIEPKFFVTRYCHGSPMHYHRKLIGQKLERTIVISTYDMKGYYYSLSCRSIWFSY